MTIQFIPTEEQTMLRDGLRRWASARELREAEAFEPTWSYGAEQGWLMAGLPEAAGGLGGSAFDSAIIAEELGRALVRAPFVEIGMVAAQLLLSLDPARVADIASGELRPLLAHDEVGARGDPDWVETRATRNADSWLLTGRKTGLVGARHADRLIVSAQTGDGIGLFELAASDAPLKAFVTIDDRSGGELLLDATSATLLAIGDTATNALYAALDHALVLESAEALGAMERAMEMTRDYLLTRKQYGQLIGDFQVLRHRLADMFIETEQARSIVLRGLEALVEAPPTRRAALAAATKARVAQAGLFVGAQSIQLHGGIGVTDEYPIGHLYKRLLAFAQRHGGEARQVERFAQLRAGNQSNARGI
jgi:alkylation response protein AidB-like acyl-CoA dehydrogenase